MSADDKKIREAEKLIDVLMDGLPSALETLEYLDSVVLPKELRSLTSMRKTAAQLRRGLKTYESWASKRGAWASR